MLLEAQGLTKTYPGVRALDSVSFNLQAGEVHAVVGENGAGKSTLMHLLSGVTLPDSGQVLLDGDGVTIESPSAANELGIAVVFQELSLADGLSVAENIFASRQPTNRLGLIDRQGLRRGTRDLLRLFDWDLDPETPVAELSASSRQVVEILKALARKPRILILDEPTSSLNAAERSLLFSAIRKLRDQGSAVIYISHHLSEVFEIADRVTVLRDGIRVNTCDADAVDESDLVRMMVGRKVEDLYGSPAEAYGELRFQLENGSRAGVLKDISLSVRSGEILGLGGLSGAGRTELARAICGAEPLDGGAMYLDGRRIRTSNPSDAIRCGIAYLTESRKEDGLFLDMTLRQNCVAARLDSFTGALGLIDEQSAADFADSCRQRFRIASAGVDQTVESLSGGNQQKALLATWMGANPRFLIADEPTRGVDIGARSEIYQMLRQAAAQGLAILLISSDLPELLGMSDRVLVMRQGSIVGEFSRNEATEEKVIACASGVWQWESTSSSCA